VRKFQTADRYCVVLTPGTEDHDRRQLLSVL